MSYDPIFVKQASVCGHQQAIVWSYEWGKNHGWYTVTWAISWVLTWKEQEKREKGKQGKKVGKYWVFFILVFKKHT